MKHTARIAPRRRSLSAVRAHAGHRLTAWGWPDAASGSRHFAALTLALLLGACSTSAPTRYYTLAPVTAVAAASATATTGAVSTTATRASSASSASTTTHGVYAGPVLQVRAVHLPPAMDRLEVIDAPGATQVRVRDFDHWAAPLGDTARQTLTEDLVARLPAGLVLFPNLTRPPEAASLSADILSFRIDGATAEMEVSWSLLTPATVPGPAVVVAPAAGILAAVPVQPQAHPRGAQLRLQTQVRGEGAAATALALSDLLGQLADRISASLGASGT